MSRNKRRFDSFIASKDYCKLSNKKEVLRPGRNIKIKFDTIFFFVRLLFAIERIVGYCLRDMPLESLTDAHDFHRLI